MLPLEGMFWQVPTWEGGKSLQISEPVLASSRNKFHVLYFCWTHTTTPENHLGRAFGCLSYLAGFSHAHNGPNPVTPVATYSQPDNQPTNKQTTQQPNNPTTQQPNNQTLFARQRHRCGFGAAAGGGGAEIRRLPARPRQLVTEKLPKWTRDFTCQCPHQKGPFSTVKTNGNPTHGPKGVEITQGKSSTRCPVHLGQSTWYSRLIPG